MKKKGISLIILIITILVILLLAVGIILALNKNNPVNTAKQAKFKNDMKNLAYKANTQIANEYIKNNDIAKQVIVAPKVYDYLPEAQDKYKVCIYLGELAINEIDYTQEEIKWAQEIGIKVRSSNQIDNLELTVESNNITAKVTKTQVNEGDTYWYQIIGIGVTSEWVEDGDSHVFSNLKLGTQYSVNCKVINKNVESDVISKSITTDGVSQEVKIDIAPIGWTKSVTVTISHEIIASGYALQYKEGGGDWINYTVPFEVAVNEKIVARLYNQFLDDEVTSSSIDITQIDVKEPTEPTTLDVVQNTNSITVSASGSLDNESGVKGYQYSIDNSNWTTVQTQSYTYSGIKAGTAMTVYARAIDNVGLTSNVISRECNTIGIVDKVNITGIPTSWTNKKIYISLSFSNIPSEYKLQYKIGSEGWTNYTTGITISNNTKISARLYNSLLNDEVASASADITKIDMNLPNNATITMAQNSTTSNFTAKVTLSDSLSGVNVNESKYKLSIKNGLLGVESSEWDNSQSFLNEAQTINLTCANGIYYLHVLTVDNAGNKIETVSSNSVKVEVTPTGGSIYTDNKGVKVPIPAGFKVSTVAGENTVETGLVIKQGNNGAANDKDVNEFVWIPVPDINEMYDTASKRGKLYKFSSPASSTLLSLNTTTGEREPVYLIDNTNGDASSYNTIGITQQILQDEFDKMIASVATFGGFYIGRFETGNLSQNTPVVRKYNEDISNQSWYTMYSKLKKIVSSNSAQTSMIWGCQWDATLRWFNKSTDGYVSNYAASTNKGNYYNLSFTYITANGSTATKGSYAYSDKIPAGACEESRTNNIYDMGGNVWEWTIEGNLTNRRTFRGGSYKSYIFDAPAGRRYDYPEYSFTSSNDRGVRTQLYLK